MNKTRLEAFSDGVFAIVITLLILNVKLPDTDYKNLSQSLWDVLPAISAYVLSFLLVGMYWVFHHYSFTLIARVDGVLLWLNILLLLFISFLPFPAMLMGKYPFKTIPVVIYVCNLLLVNGTGFIMLMHLKRNQSLCSPLFTPAVYRTQFNTYIIVNVFYIAAMLTGFFWPVVSFIFLGVITLGLIVRSVILSGVGKCKV
jgi:uncharacterized membrane protein